MFPSSDIVYVVSKTLHGCVGRFHTLNLLVEPAEGLARQLLLRCAVGESVGYGHIFVVLEDSALHRQLVQIRIQKGDDPLRVGG
jgi:hypothetical protein